MIMTVHCRYRNEGGDQLIGENLMHCSIRHSKRQSCCLVVWCPIEWKCFQGELGSCPCEV